MWITVRVLTALAVGLLRYIWPGGRSGKERKTGDLTWLLSLRRSKSRVVGADFGLPVGFPLLFEFSKKGPFDRFFIRIGFTRALRTGDAEFDRKIYVTGDHPALEPVLQEDTDARAAVLALFQAKTKRIFCADRQLWAIRDGSREPNSDELAHLARLRAAFDAVPAEDYRSLADRYARLDATLVAVLWGLAAYGLPTFFQAFARNIPFYFDWTLLVPSSLGLLTLTLAALVVAVRVLLRNSTRAHRVFTKHLFAILLGLPWFAGNAASDINVALDRAPAKVQRAHLQGVFVTITHGRHGSTQYHYHLALNSRDAAAAALPPSIEVPRYLYNRGQTGTTVAVTMHAGALGVPWVEAISVEP